MPLTRWFFAMILIIGGFLAGKAFRAPDKAVAIEPGMPAEPRIESALDTAIPNVTIAGEATSDRRIGAIPIAHAAPEIAREKSKREIDDWESSRTVQPIPESPPPPLSAYESREIITPPIARKEPAIHEPPAQPREKSHRIADGDTLETLAMRYFNDPAAAERILSDNRHVIADRSLLPVGKTIRIRVPAP